jgi:UDP-4-amino-4,6-dideoxy-N-acetyl-beta-L-altrosamine N-acetyltransferase
MLRLAKDRDADLVRRWRNHPDVRAASLTRNVITADEHEAWWVAVQNDPTRRLLIYERHEVPSGVVTFFDHDAAARSAWWGFYLDVDGLSDGGELLPAWVAIEREAIRYAFDVLDLDVLEGEVLASNQAVRNMNRRHRFSETGTHVRDVDGQPVDVVHVRLQASDVRRH